ncbi:hypothetical protein MSI_21570 [Treponema sp. JC4]|uniref:cupin domain-containing protein n=1 Tax=Treponema sp. JC4 TaxID=1124982 RepID=UPI00025B0E5A|nr:cupin domain-containing protein [Treponema sp. JC4]EID84372.1 hypothetical protein MSI_21570 [Treponema sp. JC4]
MKRTKRICATFVSFLTIGIIFASCSASGKKSDTNNNISKGEHTMENTNTKFDVRESAITKIAGLGAAGNLEKLSLEMEEALVSKTLSQNEIGEICLQLYAYAGFPKSLNAQNTLASVVKKLDEGKTAYEKGETPAEVPTNDRYDLGREVINKIFGMNAKQSRPASSSYEETSDIFLKEHLFSDITLRGVLSINDRELATASMLAAIGNVNPQLGAHIAGTLHTGTSAHDLRSCWIPLLSQTISLKTAKNAESVLNAVIAQTGVNLPDSVKVLYKMTEEEFSAANVFGKGVPNAMFAKYFIGESFLNPLTDFQHGEFPLFNVTFEPGCRNNWHIHKSTKGGGQILICTAGEGWYQEEGKEPVSLVPGSVIVIKANTKHWHGAKKDSWFSHISLEIPGENCSNEWLESVTDEVYNAL